MKLLAIKLLLFFNTLSILCNQEVTVKQWSEFSFMLKPSPISGIGVFALHDIPAGTILCDIEFRLRILKAKGLPLELLQYCIYINDEECKCPDRFDRMEIGWFINHSSTPNIESKGIVTNEAVNNNTYLIYAPFFAIKDIKAGDEILIDYNSLNEPEHLKENYYLDLLA